MQLREPLHLFERWSKGGRTSVANLVAWFIKQNKGCVVFTSNVRVRVVVGVKVSVVVIVRVTVRVKVVLNTGTHH